MKRITWMKLSLDIFENQKIEYLGLLPNGDKYFKIWIQLMVIAGKSNNHGKLTIAQDLNYTPEILAQKLNHPIKVMNQALAEFTKLKMIEIDQGVIRLANWEKYQSSVKMEVIREYNREAKQKQRALEKQAKVS
jgi:predicted phage replisome organizer